MKIVNKKKYAKFLSNKKVVLVGPAWDTKGMGQGKLINSYDVVIRMNNGVFFTNKLKNDLGNRTDFN